MRDVSREYKEAMSQKIRDRAYVSVSLGVVNNDAQKSARVTSECVDWCDKNAIFTNKTSDKMYATMEENFFKVDGSMILMPEYIQELKPEAISNDILGPIRIEFDGVYAIKGLTLEFGEYYPTEFMIETAQFSSGYLNDLSEFTTTENLGETSYILITPVSMIGGKKRLRIKKALMGIGLSFSNSDIKDILYTDFVSTISEELPGENIQINLFDKNDQFNIDDKNSYIQFLDMGQEVSVSFGITLDNGKIEWLKHSTLYLTDWDSKKGSFTINAADQLSFLEDEYTLANRLYTRTAYDEAVSVLSDAGLEPDDYILDECMQDVVLTNPMPTATHRECLQLLANACRCIISQNEHGQIVIRANFANVVSPEEIKVESNTQAEWSNINNIISGSDYVYADMTQNFFKVDGSMILLPEDANYLKNGYVSLQVSDSNGQFETNPKIGISLPAAYSYQGVTIDFGGNAPNGITIYTYLGDSLVQTEYFSNYEQTSVLFCEFKEFDRMAIEFTSTIPYNRVVVNQISFGDLTDYVLTKSLMMEEPHGYAEEKVKSVNVRVYTFTLDENGDPEELDRTIYVKKNIGITGKNKVLENQLISTTEHAELVGTWLANYYANNASYDINYRGEPRIEAGDIIKIESDVLSNLQVEVNSHTLKFNGAFSGSLELRKAFKMVQT